MIFDLFNLNLGQQIFNMIEKMGHLFNPAPGLRKPVVVSCLGVENYTLAKRP